MVHAPFIWGRAGAKLTPDQVAREREAADLLAKGAMDFSPVSHWSQGLGRVAQGLLAGLDYRAADRGEADIADRNKALVASLLSGGSAAGTAPASSSIPMTSAAGEMAATAPGSAVGAGPEAFRNAIASIESAGSGDYSAVGPTNKNLGRALGRYQIMEANIGPWSREALGREVTPEEFLADPSLQDAIFDSKFGQYVQQFGPEGAAQAWFAGPGGVGKTERQDVLGTNVGEYGSKFLNALGASPETSPAASAIEAVAPADEPQLMADFSGSNQLSNAQGGITPALTGGIPASPEQIARAQAAAQAPIEVAGGGDRVPMAATGTSGINPAIIEALTDPQASPQTQRIAGILLEQQQRQAQAAEEQRLQAADPMRQLQLEKLRREVQAPIGGDETFFGNPVPFRDTQGNIRYGQIGNRGSFRPIDIGEGASFAPPTRTINTGTELITIGPGDEILSRRPIENEAAAAARARGTTLGQTTAEREMSAPTEIQAGQNALDIVDSLVSDPNREWGTGMSSVFNIIHGTPGYDFQSKVNQATSGAFLTAIEQMRGLGALSNAEGQTATRAVTRMETATSEGAFLEAAEDYKKIVRQGIERAQGRIQPQTQQPSEGTGQKRLKFNPATGELE